MSQPERIAFRGSLGETLQGRLHRPVGPIEGVALFAHCFTCTKDLRAARHITDALASAGIATLRFDFTGLGESAGDFADTHFSSNVADLVAAAGWLEENLAAPQLLVGHSLGGAAVLLAASEIASVQAVATVGAPSDPAHVEHLFAEHAETLESEGEAEVCLAGRTFRVRRAFVDDLRRQSLLDRVAALRRGLLILHSPQDNTVGVGHARALFEAARHPKSFISLDGADHLLSKPADAEYAGCVIAGWARRHLPPLNKPARPRHSDDVEVVTGPGFASEVVVKGRHRLRADEPVEMGGTDIGPAPYDLLCAALGTCTTMTLRMYADRKGLALDEIHAHVRHQKVVVDGEKVDRFERTIELRGDLGPEVRERMLQIADRCPVHRTLHGRVEVVTSEV